MAGFGGSIKLTGENEYKNALKQINQSLREVSSSMNLTKAQFDSSDKSVSALAKAQKELSQAYEKQKSEVENLKNAYNSFSDKVNTQVISHQKLVAEYNKEKVELERLEKEVGTTSQKYQDQKSKVEELSQEVAKSQKNVDENKNALSRMATALNKAEAELVKTSNDMDKLGKETQETTEEVKKSGEGFTVFKGILANLGTQAINGAINGLKSLGSAVVNVGKQAILSYADYEQLAGGVETLFKDSAPIVKKYANEAYKTAGLSANEYMETVTSFSASLISSIGGDTKKAAEYSNRAITDMSDNANKMGTDIGMLQNAYQGFAKQNYTMLDNLKLGYGGTKTEMQRLIKDASKLTDVQKELGITVDANDMSFGNIVNAISVVQKEMGIMGTTSKEASETISGSISSMKSAWQNLLTGIADDNADFTSLVNNFVDSLVTVGKNLLPRIQVVIQGLGTLVTELLQTLVPEIVNTIPPLINDTLPVLITAVQTAIQGILAVLPQIIDGISAFLPQIITALVGMLPQIIDVGIKGILSLIDGITQALPQLIAMLPTVIKSIVDTLLANLPQIIQTGVELLVALINGLAEAIPQLIDYVPEIIETIITVLIDNLPLIIDCAIQIMVALIQGLTNSLPKLVAMVPQIIQTIVSTLVSNFPKIIKAGGEILKSLINGVQQLFPNLTAKAKEIIDKVVSGVTEGITKVKDVGKNIVEGLWNGISNAGDWIKEKVGNFAKGILDKMKSALGIHSPSKVFEDQVGKNIALGVGEGFSDEMNTVAKEMQNSIPTSFDTNINTNSSGSYGSIDYSYNYLLNAFQDALASMKIELDDEVAGAFVKRTVEKAIYN